MEYKNKNICFEDEYIQWKGGEGANFDNTNQGVGRGGAKLGI